MALSHLTDGVVTGASSSIVVTTASVSIPDGQMAIFSVAAARNSGDLPDYEWGAASGAGLTWTALTSLSWGSRRGSKIWYAKNTSGSTATGTLTVTISTSATAQEAMWSVDLESNPAASTLFGTAATNNGAATSGSVTVPGTPAAGDKVFAFFAHENASDTITLGSELDTTLVQRGSGANVRRILSAYDSAPDGTPVANASWSSSNNWGAIAVILNAGAGASPQTLTAPILTRIKTIYAPTVSGGVVTLAPPLLTRSKTIYAPTVTGGAIPATITVNTLDFAEGSNIRMRMALAAGLRTDGCTIIWREKRRTQDVYSGGFVFSDGSGSWDAGAWTALFVTHGCDGTYDSDGQKSATSGPGMYHEIAGMKSIPNGWNSRDFISTPSALGPQASYIVSYDVWVERAVVIKPVSTTLEHYNYVDFSDPTKVIQQNLLTSDPATPTNEYLDFGAPHWIGDGSEDFDGQATHIKVFSRGLSTAEIRQELDNFSDTPVVSDCWYSNYSPSHTDLTDKKPSGTAHPFTWHNGTATTVTADFDLPVTDQTLTPPLLTRTKTIYAPVVTVGAVSVAPPLLARTKTLYVPAVSVGAVTVSPGLLTRSKVLYTPSVSVGAVALTPPLLTRSKTLYTPVVSQDGSTQTLTPPLLTLAKVIYAPVVVPGAVSLEPALLTRTKTIYEPTVTQGAATLTPPLLVRDKVIYAPVVTGGDVAVLRKRAGAIRRNYLIQGKRFTLSDFELRLLLQQLTPARAEVQVVEKEDVKQISRKLWKRLRESDSALDALTLKQVDAVVQDATIEYDEDEELVMLLL